MPPPTGLTPARNKLYDKCSPAERVNLLRCGTIQRLCNSAAARDRSAVDDDQIRSEVVRNVSPVESAVLSARRSVSPPRHGSVHITNSQLAI